MAPISPLLASTLIGAGGSLLGGILGNAQANRSMRTPSSVTNQIEALQNPDYYAPLLQRIFGAEQGFSNITRSLARDGVKANANLMSEINEQQESQATNQVTQAMRGMEGQRLSALGQLEGINQNYRMGRAQAGMSATNSALTGLAGSFTNYFGSLDARRQGDAEWSKVQELLKLIG